MRTNKLKKILIALDYDPTAQKVAETGFALAKTLGAEVTLLHVIADSTYYSTLEYSPIMGFNGFMDMGSIQIDNPDWLKNASLHYLEKTKHHLGDEAIEIIVKDGEFAETILKTAKQLHIDILIMGSHSRRWLDSIIMGSVTEEVLHHTTIPLFIVPTKKHS